MPVSVRITQVGDDLHRDCIVSMNTFLSVVSLICAVAAVTSARAANWPQFRGSEAKGIEDSSPVPVKWNVETGENVRWRTPIPGLAHSAPIVWGDRVYVATAVLPGRSDLKVGLYGDIASVSETASCQWRLLALDEATGRVIWNVLGHESVPRVSRHTKATHCNSTPATDGRRIVAIFGSEGLFCFDLNGRLVWKKDLGPMDSGYFQVPTAQWGFASSPVIFEDKVVVQCDVQEDSFLAVFALDDGREIWRVPRSDVPTWSTPTVVRAAGRTQIAINGWRHTGGYDFVTGRELWKLDGGGDIPVPTPIVRGDVIYFTSSHGRMRPMRAIRADATGDLTSEDGETLKPGMIWNHDRLGSYMQTPILVGDLLYGCTDNGLLTCFDAATGKVQFSHRLSDRGQGFTASPVSDARHIYYASEIGNVFVVPAKSTFSVAAENALGETCLATPAISRGTLYVRGRDHLFAIGAAR